MPDSTPVTGPSSRRRRANSLAVEAAFRARIVEIGGQVVGEYVNGRTPVDCMCAEGHRCSPRPENVLRGQGMCRTCVGQDPFVAEAAFRARIAELGGTVIEARWLGSLTPHRLVCSKGHDWRPRPNDLQQGKGTCRACKGLAGVSGIARDSAQVEAAFRDRVAELGGRVVGDYLGTHTPVACVCAVGHSCRPRPGNTLRGQGMCRTCVGQDPFVAEAAFRARIAELGGRVIGEWRGSKMSVECLCPQGHLATPIPNCVQQGDGICRICAGRDRATVAAAFYARIAELGGEVVGQYAGSGAPVDCLCSQGHPCSPMPSNIKQGVGMCRTCANMVWDVFYVTINPTLGRVKFGVTSGDERHRLSRHRRAGYVDVVRVFPDLPSAPALERHLLATLRDAGMTAVQGREYFDASALALVLDVAAGWAA